MTTRVVSLAVAVLVVLILVGAVLAQQIGGVSIRLTEPETVQTLVVGRVVVRGVPTLVSWSAIGGPRTLVEFVWQAAEEQQRLGTVQLHDKIVSARVVFPCAGSGTGRLLLRQVSDGRVRATGPVQLLPPGEDCAWALK